MQGAGLSTEQKRLISAQLLRKYQNLTMAEAETAWDYLSAAHIVAQTDFFSHGKVHWTMLKLAIKQRNGREIAGQVLRLCLIPLGHITQQLPLGNSGRANVSAFKAMPLSVSTAQLIEDAKLAVERST